VSTRFGAYEILHELKSGGMGAVLLGRRRGPGAFAQLVAVKTIRADLAEATQARAMFLDEAAILARISHPGIATVHDFGEEAGTLYMVMEYVAGTSFRGLVELGLPPLIAAQAIAEAARALHAVHEARDHAGHAMGVVHRDISPDNLMLGFDGHVKVIDFGIALVRNRQAAVTEFGTIKGKPPYMSPEQLKNESMDRRTDVFSLGVVLHELLTGTPLFDGDSIYAVARAVEHQAIVPPSVARGAPLPNGLDAAVMGALARDVSQRTSTAAQLADALEHVIAHANEETIETWTERELAAPREAHRAWLAKIVAGVEVPRRVGRPTGTHTAAMPLGPATPSESPPAPPEHTEPGLDANADAQLDRLPRRRMVVPIAGALAVVAALIIAILASRSARHVATARSVDAGLGSAIASIAVDAAGPEDASAVADASLQVVAVPADARAVVVATRQTPIVDAAVTTTRPSVDAAVAVAAPTGNGVIDIRHRPGGSYLNVVIDGRAVGATPILRRSWPAGHHVLELLAPDTGAVVYRTAFDLADGQQLRLQQE